MEETYNIQAIILNRKSYSENSSRVVVYSRESGKLELIARGTKKIKSKLAGHLEPLNLADIMVARGQRYDYAAAAASEKCFSNIKSDLAKLAAAGRAVKVLGQLIKPGVADAKIFALLKNFLDALERSAFVIPAQAGIQKELYNKNSSATWTSDYRLVMLNQFFVLKLLAKLGHEPELSRCLACAAKIEPGKNRFDLARGGLICGRCAKSGDGNQLAIADDSIKLLRLTLKCDFEQLAKVKIGKKLGREVEGIIGKFLKYHF